MASTLLPRSSARPVALALARRPASTLFLRPLSLACGPSLLPSRSRSRSSQPSLSLSASPSPLSRPPLTILAPLSPAGQRRLLSDDTRKSIDGAVASAPVVLFMKGTPELPQCGFSRAAIQILGLQGVDPAKFAAFNVLEDADLRAGIKEYSDWPTIPQLYVDGEFIGGCDILVSMHQGGDLAKLFEEKKVLVGEPEKPENDVTEANR